jgi:fatty acid desaturase
MTTASSRRTIEWYRTPIGREALRALNQRSDWKGLLQVGTHIILIVLTGMAAWHVQDRLYLLLPMLFLYGTFYVFMLNGTHELSHNSVFKTKFLNLFFLRLFCFFGWRNHVLFWESHSEHHKYTLHQPDDLEVVLPKKLTLKEFLRITFFDPLSLYQTLRKHLMHSVGRLEGEWENHLFPPQEVEKRNQLRNTARFLLVGHCALIAVSFYSGLWLLPVLTTLAPFYGGWLRFLCNQTQHSGLQDDVADFRLCTRTVILGPLTRFLYYRMNYHIEHHMYAAVPCYNLAKLHELIRHDLPHCPRGLIETYTEIIATVKRQRVEPDYALIPELPSAGAS